MTNFGVVIVRQGSSTATFFFSFGANMLGELSSLLDSLYFSLPITEPLNWCVMYLFKKASFFGFYFKRAYGLNSSIDA